MTLKSSTKAPLSSHPAFPAVIALWFAALFGIGSLAIRASLLETLVRRAGIDLLVPAAAPPLGSTARLLVALMLALAGAVIGFLLARAMAPRRKPGAASHQTGARKTETGAPTHYQPASGPDGATDPALASGDDNDDLARLEAARESQPLRRRGLTAQLLTNAQGETFADPAPFAIPVPAALKIEDLNVGAPLDPLTAVDPYPDESDNVAPKDIPQDRTPAADQPAFEPATIAAQAQADQPEPTDPTMAPADIVEQAPAAPLAPPRQALRASPLRARSGTAADALRAAPLETLGVVELVERFAIALAERRARDEAQPTRHAAAPAPAPTPAQTAVQAVVTHARADATPPAEPAPTDLPDAELAPFSDPHPQTAPVGRPFDMPALLRQQFGQGGFGQGGFGQGGIEWFGDDAATEAEAATALESLLPPKLPKSETALRIPSETTLWTLPESAAHAGEPEPGDEEDADDTDDFAASDGVAAHFVSDTGNDGQAPVGTGAFSSLLDMKPVYRTAALAEEDQTRDDDGQQADHSGDPAANAGDQANMASLPRLSGVLPTGPTAYASPAATEDALRHALATLQRMSGAA